MLSAIGFQSLATAKPRIVHTISSAVYTITARNAPFRKISNSAQSGRFALIL